jgi:hypothetical protein
LTCTSSTPCQQQAFMRAAPRSRGWRSAARVVDGGGWWRGWCASAAASRCRPRTSPPVAPRFTSASNVPLRARALARVLAHRDLARLLQRLEAAQVLAHLDRRLLAEQPRDQRPSLPAGGSYSSDTLTSVPRPPGASRKFTDPAFGICDPAPSATR